LVWSTAKRLSFERRRHVSRLEKEHKERKQWEKAKKRGHGFYVAQNVLIWLGSYAVVRLLHILCFKSGWLRSPGSMSWEDVLVCAVVAGVVGGELYWLDMKRKFRDPPPEEDWMAK
jgi:hypothetical protein